MKYTHGVITEYKMGCKFYTQNWQRVTLKCTKTIVYLTQAITANMHIHGFVAHVYYTGLPQKASNNLALKSFTSD